MSLAVAMIADDLTGALDASAPFAARGLKTIVSLSGEVPADADDAEVICINTASREIAADAAAERVAVAVESLARLQPKVFFKKMDSRLKGAVAAEIEAARRTAGCKDVLVAPAIPDLGRFVRDGKMVGMGIADPIDVATACGVQASAVAEIETDEDLDQVASGLSRDTLAVGARGLAMALSRRLGRTAPNEAPPMVKPILIAIGSRDRITQEQVSYFLDMQGIEMISAPNGAVPEFNANPLSLVVVTQADEAEPLDVVAQRFALTLSRAVVASAPATMLISGGETAYAILRTLGVKALEVVGEALPGVPCSKAVIAGMPVAIYTKSGGFGIRETITRLVGSASESL